MMHFRRLRSFVWHSTSTSKCLRGLRGAASEPKVLQWSSRRIVRHAEDASLWIRGLSAEIRDASRARDWRNARYSFDSADAKTPQLYEAMLRAALRCGCFEEGLALFEESLAEGLRPTAQMLVAVVRLHSKLGRHEEAREAWDRARAKGFPNSLVPDAYLAAIAACAEAGDLPGAVSHFEQLDANLDASPGTTHFGAVLHACAKAGDAATAQRFLEEMRLRVVPRSIVAYTCCMRALRGAPLADVAALAAQAARERLKPDEHYLEAHLEALLGRDLRDVSDGGAAGAPGRERLNAAAAALSAAKAQRMLLKATVRRLEDVLGGAGIVGFEPRGSARAGPRRAARGAGQ